MEAKMRFWLSERPVSSTKASLPVMILTYMLWYSLLIARPCFMRKAAPPLAPVERSFFYCTITLDFGIYFLRNVSFGVTMLKLFSFMYYSSSLCFGLTPWQFQNICLPA